MANNTTKPDRNKPVVHASYKALQSETENPVPFVYTNSASKRVTFPDPGQLGFEEAEQWMIDIQKMSRSRDIFLKWLSEEDYEALREDNLTLRQLQTLMIQVQAHYGDIFGEAGE